MTVDEQNLDYNQLLSLVTDLLIDISSIQKEQISHESFYCPHCKSSKTKKIGFQYGVQRYCCKDCSLIIAILEEHLMQGCVKEKVKTLSFT